MNKLLTKLFLVSILVIPSVVNGQSSNAIFFTDEGERFSIIINGLKYNEEPGTNVRAEGLKGEFFKVKAIFDDEALGQTDFNITLEPGMETTINIKKNNKGKYVGRYMGSVPISESTYQPPVAQQPVVPAAPQPVQTGTVTQTTSTTTTSAGMVPAGAGVSIGINVNEENGSMNMNMTGYDNSGSAASQTTTVTTTTTTSTTEHVQTPGEPNHTTPQYLPGYNGAIGCEPPVDNSQFNSMKGSIESKSFEDSKIKIAKQILNNSCLLSSQVKEIMLLFTFEETRLDFAKFAYGRTYDLGNYYVVNDAFTFESSIDELNDYIDSK